MPDDSNGIYNVPIGTLVNSGDTVLPSQHNPWANDSASAISNRYSKDGRAPLTGNMNVNGFLLRNLGTPTASADAATKGYVDTTVGSPVQYVAQTLTAAQQAQARSNISAPLRGHIYGLNISNNVVDGANDIDIAVGECASTEATPVLMQLASPITKQLDSPWAVGSGNGGLDTGTVANTTYHVWIIQRSDTGVVDVLFSASATSPTMPANYDRKRRIGSIIRESAAIVTFKQVGDVFRRVAALDRNSTSAVASALLALSVPSGIIVAPLLLVNVASGATVNCAVNIGSAADGSANVTVAQSVTGTGGTDVSIALPPPMFFTNSSRQIYFEQVNGSGTPNQSRLSTIGWVDNRGRDA